MFLIIRGRWITTQECCCLFKVHSQLHIIFHGKRGQLDTSPQIVIHVHNLWKLSLFCCLWFWKVLPTGVCCLWYKVRMSVFWGCLTATPATSCFTSPMKSLQLWIDWTRLTRNLTLSSFVFYFLKTSLPGKLPYNYWKKIANKEYVRSVSEKKKKN